MKLAIVDQTGNKIGGAQTSLELFLHHLPPDIEATVIFFEDGSFAERVRKLGVSTQVVPLGESVRRVTREGFGLDAVRLIPGALKPLVAVLRGVCPDIVYTNGIKAHVLGSLAARRIAVPSVVHHRDILTGTTRLAFLAVVAMCSKARIATSSNVARAYPLPNTTIVDNPIDLASYHDILKPEAARAKLGIEAGAPIAAIVGRINRWKGIDRFLRALAVVNGRTKLRGLIVGAPNFRDADQIPELYALRSKLGLNDLVSFVDWVDDARTVYAAIDVNVNTSNREPFGRTIIEAAACGVPSVCFDDSGVSETMQNGISGIVVRAHDETALAQALSFYASDAKRRAEASIAARTWSQRFDATLHARRVANILRANSKRELAS